jgi:hypothetical protein
LADVQHVVGEAGETLGDRPAVEWAQEEGLEDQEIEGSLQEIGAWWHRWVGSG